MSLTKKEAAVLLGISTRQLENYARAGRVTVRKERGKTGDISVYDEEEINQLKSELDAKRGVVQPAVMREPAAPGEAAPNGNGHDLESSEVVRAFASQLSQLTPQEFISQLAAAILTQAEQRQAARQLEAGQGQAESEDGQQRPKRRKHDPDETPISDLAAKPLLTRAEARRYTGLSQKLLRELVTSGKVSERKLGHAYRLKRAELDSAVANL
ncbi:MAG TPA: helix-turn-helix domain-containing protein [Gammaproteobacteria bacterium]|nr:helix-turn-helix domain-containing protein [Gammaproteobacteria bacterium]